MSKVKITETVLRDSHQSLIATRMTTEEMLPILEEMDKIADYITRTIRSFETDKEAIAAGVAEICRRFPLYE